VKRHELENKSFFGSILLRAYHYVRILYTNIYAKIYVTFDNWRWLLILLPIHFFFGYILPLPAVLLGLYYGGIYPYLWLGMWACVFVLWANREDKRRRGASPKYKWFYNPNALKEYVEMLKPKDK